MRLHEIKLSHAKHLARAQWTKRTVVDWLTDKGFKPIAGGAYSTVWTDQSRMVIKLSRDPSFPDYATFCRTHRGNPHLPRISRVFPITGYGVIAFLERLAPYSGDVTFVDKMDDYFAWRRVADQDPEWELPAWLTDFALQNPSIAATLDDLGKAFSGPHYFHDLNANNVMMRGATLVIIDPIKPL